MSEKFSSTEVEGQFEALVEEYEKFLRRTILQFCPKHLGIQISDIEQEAKIRLWRALQSEKDLQSPASYIYRIAMTTTIDAVRRVLARHEEQLHTVTDEGEEMTETLALSTDPEQSPERVAERQQLIEKIEAALAKLAENRRLAVEFYLQGMSSQEIADLLDWTEAKARNLLYRGLDDLRKHLREAGIDYV
jgi:RNA polymerase sigma factor (sigma-70 family)